MVVVVLSWIYYFFLCLFIGVGIEKILTKILNGKWRFQTIDHLVAGIVGITIYAAFFSIFYKVGMIAHLLLVIAAIVSAYVNRREVLDLWRKGKKLVFSWEGFFFFCLFWE